MTIIQNRPLNGGVQIVHRFPNGYGASVVRHDFSYGNEDGLWELAVAKFKGEGNAWSIDYDTPITTDVLGRLTDDEVTEVLARIEAL